MTKLRLRRTAAVLLAILSLSAGPAAADVPTLRETWPGEFEEPLAELKQNPGSLPLDAADARVVDFHAGSSGKTILHIQDAHVNPGAQRRLASTLERLIARYGIDLIFVEGGTGDDSLSFLRETAPADVRANTASRFLEKGEISGEEYLDIVSPLDRPFQLWGVEDPALYEASLEAYVDAARARKEALARLEELALAAGRTAGAARPLEDYFALNLKPDERRALERSDAAFDVSGWVKGETELERLTAEAVAAGREKVEAFYASVESRDAALVGNALSKMDEEGRDAAVLICGGYHTPGVTAMLRARGVSYAVIAPRVERETDVDNYERMLLESASFRAASAPAFPAKTAATRPASAKSRLFSEENPS